MNVGRRVLAVDLGGTRLRAALSPRPGSGLCLDHAHRANAERPLAIRQVIEALSPVVADRPIAAIGVSVAGTVEPDTGRIVLSDNLGWRSFPLAELLSAAFDVPVFVDTDTFCGARAEARWGQCGPGAALYVAIGTGIGHAWLLDNRLWRGASGAANLFGHMIVRPGGRPCYCGNLGCLCQYAAGPVMGPALAARSRPESRVILAEADEALALALAHAVTVMNPAEVILGGGVSEVWPEPQGLEVRVAELVHPQLRPVQIRRSMLGAEANVIGAGLLATDKFAAMSADAMV